jgi:hypothetical protein
MYLFLQGKPISDLSFVSLLLTFCVLFHGIYIYGGGRERIICYFIALYVLLLCVYLISNSLNLIIDWQLKPVFARFVNYLLLTPYACLLFMLIYRESDSDYAANAFLAGAFGYIIAATMGYYYFNGLDAREYINDMTKELFRYPGFSNSNYIGNAVLVMIAIAYSLRKDRIFVYTILIALTAILSQSRSVLASGMIFLLYCAAKSIKGVRRFRLVRYCIASIILMAAMYAFMHFENRSEKIALQYLERVILHSATGNIMERIDRVHDSVHRAMERPRDVLLGVGYIEDNWNPHNVIGEALLLFGIYPMLAFVWYCGYVCWRLPIILFALIGSLVEILFFTSMYDFLFCVLLIVNVRELTRKSIQDTFRNPGHEPNLEII